MTNSLQIRSAFQIPACRKLAVARLFRLPRGVLIELQQRDWGAGWPARQRVAFACTTSSSPDRHLWLCTNLLLDDGVMEVAWRH